MTHKQRLDRKRDGGWGRGVLHFIIFSSFKDTLELMIKGTEKADKVDGGSKGFGLFCPLFNRLETMALYIYLLCVYMPEHISTYLYIKVSLLGVRQIP